MDLLPTGSLLTLLIGPKRLSTLLGTLPNTPPVFLKYQYPPTDECRFKII